jgi:Na+-transporting methylmalonyl-CoA/oxaloacetate decarboxylase gamma subunit
MLLWALLVVVGVVVVEGVLVLLTTRVCMSLQVSREETQNVKPDQNKTIIKIKIREQNKQIIMSHRKSIPDGTLAPAE